MITDWIPVELTSVGKRNMVRWIHPGSEARFVEPFFRQTVAALTSANAIQKLTPIDELLDAPAVNPPRGFIFHVARCGSTLVSRSLAAVPGHRVLSEPGPVNQLLLAEQLDARRQALLLKGLLYALGGNAAGTPVFFKFSSWNLVFLAQILALFPGTPWVFVYRDPAGVLRSLSAQPPNWSNNAELMRRMENPLAGDSERLLFAVQKLLEAPWQCWTPQAKAINYAQLPGAILDIAAHFGLELDEMQRGAMQRMGRFDAKQAGAVPFQARERAPLPEVLLHAMGPLDALYGRWEQLRTSHAG